MRSHTLRWHMHELALGPRTAVMGIVNVTPDSFSDGGRFFATEAAVTQAHRLVEAGADVIDIGGESTRPFAEEVSVQEEMERVLPVIEALRDTISIPISIDTTKALVADAALAAGASIINDISALRMDKDMAGVAVRHDVPVILMHMQGKPRTMQLEPKYEDVVEEVCTFLEEAVADAVSRGVDRQKIIIDPGIGFGKTIDHNLMLIRHLHVLDRLNVPILVGPSRKAFIRKLLAQQLAREPAADEPEVETGTLAALAASALNGAHLLRVHDVANAKAMLTILDAIRNARAQGFA
jgi:dihydropteroate synthase